MFALGMLGVDEEMKRFIGMKAKEIIASLDAPTELKQFASYQEPDAILKSVELNSEGSIASLSWASR